MHRVVGCLIVGVVLAVAVQAAEATSATYRGIDFPHGDVSFADEVISYTAGDQVESPYDDPTQSLGIPDFPTGLGNGHVSLGWGGSLVVQFTDNTLTTSGDASTDLWIFEVGAAAETIGVEISTDRVSWIHLGSVGGVPSDVDEAATGIDLDTYVPDGVVLGQNYSYLRLTDTTETHLSGYPYAGADIDAIGVTLPGVIPEPVTLLSLFGGLVGLGGYLRRRVL